VDRRNQDFDNIYRKLILREQEEPYSCLKKPKKVKESFKQNVIAPTEMLDESLAAEDNPFDCVIWVGDLNYRINGVLGPIAHAMQKNMYEVLLDNDQLTIERKIGRLDYNF